MDYTPPEIFELHASSLDWFFDCPRRTFYGHRQLGNMLEPTRWTTIAGTGYHAGIELNMSSVLDKEELAPFDDVETAAVEKLRKDSKDFEILAKENEKGKKKDVLLNEQERRVRDASAEHYNELAPKLKPQKVERRLVAKIDDERLWLPVRLMGRPDLEEAESIRDNKLRGRTPKDDDPEARTSLQLYAYHLMRKALSVKEGELKPAKLVYLDITVPLKKSTNLVTLTGEPTEELDKRFWETLGWVTQMVKTRLFFPNPKSMLCNPNGCVWHATGVCEHGKRS